ncbi:unnamed protein product [Adineta steineri]|uniref:PLAT domain-containing protein n=1 Tax=Adineta steineri TaxID=433720 RepID=A0A815A3T2_9BILA|nr:unnamed protein product [Adineta steineri]CAF4010772.1 unnamed protein product [Adineta steineri]
MNSSSTEALSQAIIPITINDQDLVTKINQQENVMRRRRPTCFEWTQLIATISIPLVIAIYTIVENHSSASIADNNRRKDNDIANISRISEREIAQSYRLNELAIAEKSREKDRILATDQQLENILVGYQDFLAKLILDNGLTLNRSLEAKVVARFKTLTALNQLDARRKSILIRSLYDAKLITLHQYVKSNDRAVLDLRQLDITDVIFGSSRNSPAQHQRQQYIDWDYLWLPESILINASFRYTRLNCATFSHTILDSGDLSFTAHHRTFSCFNHFPNNSINFDSASLVNATLYNAYLVSANFFFANLTFANMRLFLCEGCIFWKAKLIKADLTSSKFSILSQQNTLHLNFREISLREAVAHSATFEIIDFEKSDWSNVQASKIIINNCIFFKAIMVNCSFVNSSIQHSIFENAILNKTDLSYAKLQNVTFINSDMRYTNFSFIKCTYCRFINVTLQDIILKNASLQYSDFYNSPINISQLEETISIVGTRFFNGTVQLNLGTLEEHLNKITYNIRIKTGEIFQSETDADVYLKILGENNYTNFVRFKSTDQKSMIFKHGSIHYSTYEFNDLGKIKYIIIGHNGNNSESGWFLDWIEIDVPLHEEIYRFVCNRWLDKNKDDGKVELELIPSKVIKTTIILYQITVITGNKIAAGTDADVFLIIYGEDNQSDEHQLIHSKTYKNSFEQNQEDVFEIKILTLGKLKKIRIRHDNSGLGPGWYLDRILIHDTKTDQRYHFICEKWLSIDEDDRMISYEIFALQSKEYPLSVVTKTISRSSIDYYTQMKTISNTYKVYVVTSGDIGSGTNANVYIIIFGEYNNTGKVHLLKSKTHQDPFERGQTDLFEIAHIDIVLYLFNLRIGHDNSAFQSDWLLERVEISRPKFDQKSIFSCGKWLRKTKDQYQLEIELFPNIYSN